MKRYSFLGIVTASVAMSVATAHGTILVELSGGYLKAGLSGTTVPYSSGMLMLVASTEDSVFDAVTTSSLFSVGSPLTESSDDYVLFKSSIGGDGNNSGTNDAGEFQQAITITLGDTLSEGDLLQLFWFPTLASTDTSATEGTLYGSYRSTIANTAGAFDLDGSSPWYLPADGTSGYSLLFITSDAGSAINTATSGTQFGQTESAVIAPEPSTVAMLAGGILGLGLYRRRQSAAPGS